MNVAYFVTSHGYGHGVRSCAISRCFPDDTGLFVRSGLPEAFFRQEIARPLTYVHTEFDCGCIQHDSITVDVPATVSRYREIAESNCRVLEREVRWAQEHRIDIIVGDITPFAFDIACRAGIPSVAVTNFTWYDIYAPYVDRVPGFASVVDGMREQYGKASVLLALRPAGDMPYFRRRIDMPPVGRAGHERRAHFRRQLGLAPDSPLALVYLGGGGMDGMSFEGLGRFDGWSFVGTYPLPGAPGNYHRLDPATIHYADLVRSVDLVAGKLGYATVAECMINGTPLLYLPRCEFAEYPVLERAVKAWGYGYCLSVEEYRMLRWGDVLEEVLQTPSPLAGQAGGADACARAIVEIARDSG